MTEITPHRPRWWQWPTVLSLDAPLVAVTWQAELARAARVPVGAAESLVLGLSVWLAYAADRWIGGWQVPPERVRTDRHRFYQLAWRPLACAWILVLAADLAIALERLSGRELRAGCVLLAPVLLYVLSHQFLHRDRPLRPPKELCVALLFGAGASVFIISSPGFAGTDIAGPLALFTLLCFVNCALISRWEREVDLSHGEISLSLQFRHAAVPTRILPWAAAIAALAAVLAMGRMQDPPSRSAALCAASSGFLMGVVDLAEGRLGRRRARVLVDAALLTPLLPLALPGFS
jgi:hypothetical protein